MENIHVHHAGQTSKTLTKLSNPEKQNLAEIISHRISVIQKCKQNLAYKTKALIKQIEKVSNKNLKELNHYIQAWQELLSKEEYDEEELIQIRKLKEVKIVANENIEFFKLKEVIDSYNEDPFFVMPIYKGDYQQKWEVFQKNCFKQVNMIYSTNDRSAIVTSGVDGVIRFWDKWGRVKDVLYFGQQKITALTLSSDLQYLVFGSNKNSLTISNLQNRNIKYSHSFHSDQITSLAVSSNNQFVFSGSYKQILISDLSSRCLKFFNHFNGLYINLKHQGTSDYFLLQNSTELLTLNLNFEIISTVNYNPNCSKHPSRYCKSGRFVVTRSNKDQVYVYKTLLPGNDQVSKRINGSLGVNRKVLHDLRKLNPKGNLVAGNLFISEDFKYIAYESDKVIYVWSTVQEKIINSYNLKRYQGIVKLSYEIVYLDGDHKSKGKVFCWNFISNDLIRLSALIDETSEIFSVYTTSNKDKVVIASRESIEILDNSKHTPILSKFNKEYDNINNAMLTRKNLLITIRDKKVEGFDVKKKSEIFRLKLPFSKSTPFGFLSGDETLLYVMSDKEDYSVIINLEKGEIVGEFPKRSGLSSFYWDSFDNTDIGHYLIITFELNKLNSDDYY